MPGHLLANRQRQRALQHIEESVALHRKLGTREGLRDALDVRGDCLGALNRFPEARAAKQEAAALRQLLQ